MLGVNRVSLAGARDQTSGHADGHEPGVAFCPRPGDRAAKGGAMETTATIADKIVKEIAESCYIPLFKLIKARSNLKLQ